jgi:hypothetical protein
MAKQTQVQRVLKHMLQGKSINRLEAIHWGWCWELSARMCEIEDRYGVRPQRKRVKLGELSMTEYWLSAEDIDKVNNMRGFYYEEF